ncbi:GNAT family N-acetyltransferase [Amycolatopsis jiangsuensis]|uniref:GNAT superfamily N-acetyltransferase n=1 Tax=Amycolatopsis jiangsuensis TaxID=1181879 RepID=A0A840IYW0_9PSEU|nr:GNAT family N-acetyltransferase [Amycolatopsis jiangsuensis]MBB4686477.1 GNAT superfamily N-acetyltransferase [Amycolatopsis jiangsuensis]
MEWTITEVPSGNPSAVAVVREYLDEVASRYYRRPATPAEVDAVLAEEPAEDLVPPRGAFLLARCDEETVGCAGVRVVGPGCTELTKVYVRPAHRGHGGGRRLVGAAEAVASTRLGSVLMRLDTRHDLVEARALYAATGYAEVEPFNDDRYAEHWFAKRLG